MSDVGKICELLKTTKNGVNYSIFRRKGFRNGQDFDSSICTYHISTLEAVNLGLKLRFTESRLNFPFVSDVFAGIKDRKWVQIVARKDACPVAKFVCWAENGEFITGTAVLHASDELPENLKLVPHHDSFRKKLQGISLNLFLFPFARVDNIYLDYLRDNIEVIIRQVSREAV